MTPKQQSLLHELLTATTAHARMTALSQLVVAVEFNGLEVEVRKVHNRYDSGHEEFQVILAFVVPISPAGETTS